MTPLDAILDGSLFALLAAVFVILPGACVSIALGSACTDVLERLLVAVVGGFIAVSTFAIWVAPIHPGLVWLLPAACFAYLVRRRNCLVSLVRSGSRSGAGPVAIALLLVAVGLLPRLDYLDPVAEGFALSAYYDHFLHTAAIGELLRNVPIEQMPHVAGEIFWRYHPFTNLFEFLFVRFGGLDPVFTHLVLLHGFAWLTVALGIAVVIRSWTGSTAIALIGIASFFCPLSVQKDALLIQHNTPSLLALVPFLGAVWAITRDARAPSRPTLVFASICVAAIFPTKANVFLAAFPALALYALAALRRNRRMDVVCGAVAGAVVLLVPGLLHLTHPLSRDVGFEYGRFAGFIASRIGSGIDPSGPFGPTANVLLWFWELSGLFWIGAALGILLVVRRRRGSVGLLAGGGFLLACLLISLFLTERGAGPYEAWNIAWFLRYPLALLVVMAGVAGFGATVTPLLRDRVALSRWAVPFALLLQFASTSISLAHGNPEEPLFVSRGWMNAMLELRERAPLDAIVATEQNLWGGTYTSGFSLRRVLVERVVLMATYYDTVPSRMADIDLLWGSPDVDAVRAVLDARRVTHLVERTDRPIPVAGELDLEPFFQQDGIRIWGYAGAAGNGPLSDVPRLLHQEATRRYRAVLEVSQGAEAGAVARREGVRRETLELWIRRARSDESILDEPWPAGTRDDNQPS